MTTAITYTAYALLLSGFFFIFAGAIGIVRLPDFYTRLHAMGKCDTLGVALMVFGVAMLQGASLNGAKVLLLILFIALANPTATHALGRAAHRTGLAFWTSDSEEAQ